MFVHLRRVIYSSLTGNLRFENNQKNGIMVGKDSAESKLDFQKKRAFKALQTVEVTIRRKNEYY